MKLFQIAIFLLTFWICKAQAAYDSKKSNIALYWGAGGNQESLGYYCKSGAADIIMLSFLNKYNRNSASFNFGNACGGDTCPQIEEDIKLCQKLGIKVLLSLGGDHRRGKYGLKNDNSGESLAAVIYNMFHPDGTAKVKPFGTAEIDGLDFDIENHNDKGLAALVTKLRKLWTTKTLLISACPQCPYPDKNVSNLLKDKDAKVDLAFIQYYNNPCGIRNEKKFKENWKIWENFQSTLAGNPNLKLYIGLSASSSSGYTKSPSVIKKNSEDARSYKYFGGFFLWDAVSGFTNVDKKTGLNYVFGIRQLIRSDKTYTSTVVSEATSTSLTSSTFTSVVIDTSLSVLTTTSEFVYMVNDYISSSSSSSSSFSSFSTTTSDDVQNKEVISTTTLSSSDSSFDFIPITTMTNQTKSLVTSTTTFASLAAS